MVSIQSIKGVSIGPAWEVAASKGSDAHDEIFYDERAATAARPTAPAASRAA